MCVLEPTRISGVSTIPSRTESNKNCEEKENMQGFCYKYKKLTV